MNHANIHPDVDEILSLDMLLYHHSLKIFVLLDLNIFFYILNIFLHTFFFVLMMTYKLNKDKLNKDKLN